MDADAWRVAEFNCATGANRFQSLFAESCHVNLVSDRLRNVVDGDAAAPVDRLAAVPAAGEGGRGGSTGKVVG
ncbi:hypothetical protein GCM10010505_50910 [Kitasatospora aburaviensis]